MKKVRVYELAKELELSSKDLIAKLEELEIEVSSHMSTLEAEDAELIKSLLTEEMSEQTEETEVYMENIENDLIEDNIEEVEEIDEDVVYIQDNIVIKEFADKIEVEVSDLILKLMGLGVMANQNQTIDFETAAIVAEEFGVEIKELAAEDAEELMIEALEEEYELDFEDKEEDLKSRPPIVTVMGHVDHGKTSLLDTIKKTRVTDSEAGGITQHMGAYMVTANNKKITFLDTPGHEAFTSMRARGTQITDIAILVVAANDGVMPQTVEAINHAQAANVPIIVALNKIDLPESDQERAKQELLENNLVPEEWGGSTIVVPVSAKTGDGIKELLEMVLLVAELEELKANPDRTVLGTVVEARLDIGKGPMATVLVQKGTLKVGDTVVSGTAIGRIRAMFDDKGEPIKEAKPSVPAVVLGLSDTPNAGDLLYSVKNDKIAREYINKKQSQVREMEIRSDHKVSLDDLFEQIRQGELKDLNIIIKADVKGAIEALSQSLEKLDTNEEVNINIIHGGVGGITESDVMLASASNALIIGFNVRPNLNAIETAKREQVEVRTYRVIYEAIEDIQAAVKGMQAPTLVEEVSGRAEIRDTFKVPGGTVAGIYVLAGKILRNGKLRLLRDDVVLYEGEVASLRRFKDDVAEVNIGYEAGLGIEGYNDVKVGDLIEAYVIKEVKPK